MKINIYFKAANTWNPYDIQDDEFTKLQDDYSHFIESGSPKIGSYTMASTVLHTDNVPRIIMLKFDDISFG